MKGIIIYATKYGSVENAAKMLTAKLSDPVVMLNVMKETVSNLDDYDTVILGGSIYVGKIQKKLTDFVHANLPVLLKKRVGLFICAAQPETETVKKELSDSFPTELCQHAICKEVFGYEINFKKLNFFEKMAVRSIMGLKESYSNLSLKNIERFAKTIMTKQ